MILQDFNPMVKTVQEFIEFCKHLEDIDSTENPTGNDKMSTKGMLNKNKKHGRDSTHNYNKDGNYHCEDN